MLEVKKHLTTVSKELEWENLNMAQWKHYLQIERLLKPFADQTNVTSSEKSTLHFGSTKTKTIELCLELKLELELDKQLRTSTRTRTCVNWLPWIVKFVSRAKGFSNVFMEDYCFHWASGFPTLTLLIVVKCSFAWNIRHTTRNNESLRVGPFLTNYAWN